MTLRITVLDVETGDSDTAEIPEGDYILIAHDPCHLAGTQIHANGTHVLTVKGHHPRSITEGNNE